MPSTNESPTNIQMPSTDESPTNIQMPSTDESPTNIQMPSTDESPTNIQMPSTDESPTNIQMPSTDESPTNIQMPSTDESPTNIQMPSTDESPTNIQMPSTDESPTNIQMAVIEGHTQPTTSDKIHALKSEDGKVKKNLIKNQDLKPIFLKMKRELPSIITGSTMEHELMKQIINLLFCKIYDERSRGDEDVMEFRSDISDTPKIVKERIDMLFERVKTMTNLSNDVNRIEFSAEAVFYFVKELQDYNIQESRNDTIGDVFETFTEKSLKGELGQFFTPRNVVEMMVKMVDIKSTDIMIDPACGSGGFLASAFMHIKKDFPGQIRNIRGIDRDSFLCRIATVHMNLIGGVSEQVSERGRADASETSPANGIFCDDSLLEPSEWRWNIQDSITRERPIDFGKFEHCSNKPPIQY